MLKLTLLDFWIFMRVTMAAFFVSAGHQMANMCSLVVRMTWSPSGLLQSLQSLLVVKVINLGLRLSALIHGDAMTETIALEALVKIVGSCFGILV
jgi:hypothetical protein